MQKADPYAKTKREAEKLYKKLYGRNNKPKGNQYKAIKPANITLNDKVVKPKISETEARIAEFLSSQGVKFYQQYRIGVKISGINKTLFCDFFLPEYDLVIEYLGPHHFQPIYGEEELTRTQRSDAYKNNWARKNNKHILSIGYLNEAKAEDIICEHLDSISPNI